MEVFTQVCVWFLFVCLVCESGWKGYKRYKLIEEEEEEVVVEEVVEEVCEGCGSLITGKVKDTKKDE
tara:strand:+ start:2523 stop:2723 length:201 start_codon:yes stop_codon:yes gene_type:complete